MAITLDQTSDGGETTSSATLTWSHTIGAGSNTILWVGGTMESVDDVTGCTYNGVAMTGLTRSSFPTGAGQSFLFYLVAPTVGAHNVVLSHTGTIGRLTGVAASYFGAAQTGVPDAQNTGTTTAQTSITVTVTVGVSDSWLIMMTDNNNGTGAAGTNTTLREAGSDASILFDSNGGVATGSRSLQMTMSSGNASGALASFAPYVAPSGPTNLKSLDGNLKANIKSFDGNLIANIKSIDGNA